MYPIPVSSYTWIVALSPSIRMTSPTRLSWPTRTYVGLDALPDICNCLTYQFVHSNSDHVLCYNDGPARNQNLGAIRYMMDSGNGGQAHTRRPSKWSLQAVISYQLLNGRIRGNAPYCSSPSASLANFFGPMFAGLSSGSG
jgi:hypothetical protein